MELVGRGMMMVTELLVHTSWLGFPCLFLCFSVPQ